MSDDTLTSGIPTWARLQDESHVASVLVHGAKYSYAPDWAYQLDVEWLRVLKYEALYLMIGKATEEEFRAAVAKELPEYANNHLHGDRHVVAGLRWLRSRWAELAPRMIVVVTPGQPVRYYGLANLLTGKAYMKVRRVPKDGPIDPDVIDPSRIPSPSKARRLKRLAREAAFPPVMAGTAKLEEFHQELLSLRMNGEENMEMWCEVGNRSDTLRLLASIRNEYVGGSSLVDSILDAGAPRYLAGAIERIFSLDTNPEV